MPFAAIWMDLEITILSEANQREKDKYHVISLIYGIQKKKVQMNLFTKSVFYVSKFSLQISITYGTLKKKLMPRYNS